MRLLVAIPTFIGLSALVFYFLARPDPEIDNLESRFGPGTSQEALIEKLKDEAFGISIWNGSDWDHFGGHLSVPSGILRRVDIFDHECIKLDYTVVYVSEIQRIFREKRKFHHRFYYFWWISNGVVYKSLSVSDYYIYDLL